MDGRRGRLKATTLRDVPVLACWFFQPSGWDSLRDWEVQGRARLGKRLAQDSKTLGSEGHPCSLCAPCVLVPS
eukprot:scaffold431_cov334-Pavlova_lutheri.AAC.34